MRNNKGFSLVELIIVIAIMAILVGVMAPQLIKYIEKSNVSADTQLCDSIHTAVVTAMMDPEVLADSLAASKITALSATTGTIGDFIIGGDKFTNGVADILGVATGTAGLSEISLKSHSTSTLTASNISIHIANNRCYVWIDGSDATGSKGVGPSGTATFISVY